MKNTLTTVIVAMMAGAFFFFTPLPLQAAMTGPFEGFGPSTGTGLFFPSSSTAVVKEIFDLAELLPDSISEFGFYFGGAGDPRAAANRVLVFDQNDRSATGTGTFIDFSSGVVWDIDEAAIQSQFKPMESTIGLYARFNDLWLFSQSRYNPPGFYVGTYPSLTDPDVFLIAFGDSTTMTPLSINVAVNMSPVPVPGALALLGAGLSGLLISRRRKN